MKKEDLHAARDRMKNPLWRLNNLYYIIGKDGNKQKFCMNWAQEYLYKNIWYANVILKARQLGISTFVCLLFLDRCLFNSNLSAGIIAHTREDAEYLFKRVKFAYDQLPDELKKLREAKVDSARELQFSNNSSLRVGTSMRSSTLQYLHISEFGKICAHFPEKAKEIISGSLNTIGLKQHIFIESTAEGRDGPFYDICKKAEDDAKEGRMLTPLDYRFFFFPWWKCKEYVLDQDVVIPKETDEYFESIYQKGIDLTQGQKVWYHKKMLTQKEDMKREYPSTPEESFSSSVDGSYYAKWLSEARFDGRISNVPWDRQAMVNTAWDLGYGDSTAIIFFQMIGGEIHVIDYYENSGEGLPHYATTLKQKPYIYQYHFAPQDIESHPFATGTSAKEVGAGLGLNFITLPTIKLRLEEGIEALRGIFPRIWFDEKNTKRLISCLDNYRREYDIGFQVYKNRPRHDWSSHGADAARYMALAVKRNIDASKAEINDSEHEALMDRYQPRFGS